MLKRAAEIQGGDLKLELREIPVSLSSQTRDVMFMGVPEVLLHEPQAVDTRDLERTGAVLMNHDANQIIGRPKDVTLDEKARVVRSTIVFDQDPESERAFKKVQSGSLRGVSVGYRVQKWVPLNEGESWTSPGGQRFEGPMDIAAKWKIKEYSLTPIPADSDVGPHRSEQGVYETTPTKEDFIMKPELRTALLKRGLKADATDEEAQDFAIGLMPEEKKREETPEPKVEPKAEAKPELDARAAVAEERNRISDIGQLVSAWPEHPEVRDMERGLVADGVSIVEARKRVMDKLAELRKPLLTARRIDFGEDERDKRRNAAEDLLLFRIGKLEDKDAARLERRKATAFELECHSLLDIARSTQRAAGHRVTGMRSDEIALRAMSHTTSDFPKILENVAGKVLLKHWSEAPSTYESLVTFASVSDFKNVTRYKLGDTGDLVLTPEGTPMAEGSVPEVKGSYGVATYTKRFGITRNAIINDDLSALNQIPALMGAACRRTVNKAFWTLLTSASGVGPTMDEDSTALFATTHASGANYTNGVLVLAPAGLGTAKALVRLQKGLAAANETAPTLNITSRYLVVPAAQEIAALQAVAAITPALTTSVNPFAGAFQVIVEPLLDGAVNGGTAWYLVADPSQFPGAEAAFLNGQREPTMIRVEGDNILGVEWGIYIDFGFKFLDHRSWYRAKNA